MDWGNPGKKKRGRETMELPVEKGPFAPSNAAGVNISKELKSHNQGRGGLNRETGES